MRIGNSATFLSSYLPAFVFTFLAVNLLAAIPLGASALEPEKAKQEEASRKTPAQDAQTKREGGSRGNILVKASSEEDAVNVAQNVLGQNLDTRWSAEGDEQWIELQFSKPVPLDYVDLAFYKGASRRAYFDIKTSMDGEHWDNQISDGVSSGKANGIQRFTFPSTLARFVRFVGYGNNSTDATSRSWNSLTVFDAGSSKHDINNAAFQNRNKIQLSRWKILFPDGSEAPPEWLVAGKTRDKLFFYDDRGGLVFRTPNLAAAGQSARFSRTELREMLMGANSGGQSAQNKRDLGQGYTKNNWVLSVADQQFRDQVGGVDGRLEATLAINQVSSTGETAKLGRVVIGQVQASQGEPLKLFYRLLPGHTKGSVYMNTQTRSGKVRWYKLLGAKAWKQDYKEPKHGIALNELWSYVIDVDGLNVSVSIEREGKETRTKRFKMHSRYKNDWMYFKAGNYNLNNTGDANDFTQLSFYRLIAMHE